jgi:hypothetical protein
MLLAPGHGLFLLITKITICIYDNIHCKYLCAYKPIQYKETYSMYEYVSDKNEHCRSEEGGKGGKILSLKDIRNI